MSTVQPVQTNGVVKQLMVNGKDATGKNVYGGSFGNGLEGPDQVLPTDSYIATSRDGRVKLRLSENNINSVQPISVPGLLSRTVKAYPDQIALVARSDANGQRRKYTYKQYEQEVRTVAKAFLKLGLERYHGVCILGFNSPEWFISDLAAIYAGGFAVGVYTTNSPEACKYCAANSQANIIVVEDSKQLDKILEIKDELPDLKAIIMYDSIPEQKGVLSWDDLLKIGNAESDDKLDEVLTKIASNECCTLVYTSGTVGNPKAVMLCHDNLIYDALAITTLVKCEKKAEIIVSYLPLSHVAAQIIDIYCCILVAGTIYFADNNALKGSLINTLLVGRPTIFLGVPRVWEKIYERMQAVARNNGYIKSWIASWAKAQGLYYNMNKINGNDVKHWGYIFAKWLVFNKVKAALGLDRCRYYATAAAPLSIDIKQYFMSLDIPIMEAYGMSECSGAHTLCMSNYYRMGSVGTALPGVESKLHNPDDTGEGEICFRGRHVFMGYLNELTKTAEALDEEGWLHSGDLGKQDSEGFLYITGRIKELIITAGGENIPPIHIEQLILSELPALSNVLLIGDRRKYLTILVTLKTEMNIETGEPKETFTVDTLKWLQSIGSSSKTVTDVLQKHDPLVHDEIDKAIKRANAKVISNAQKVQKFRILPHDFSIPTGELGPTLKVKRNVVYKMYENLIEDMYQ